MVTHANGEADPLEQPRRLGFGRRGGEMNRFGRTIQVPGRGRFSCRGVTGRFGGAVAHLPRRFPEVMAIGSCAIRTQSAVGSPPVEEEKLESCHEDEQGITPSRPLA